MTVKRIGMILPSSNTVVEPVCMGMAARVSGVSVHFSRFALTAVKVDDPAAAYYGYASAAAWTLGSVATIASNHLARRAENTLFAHDVENRG